MKFVDRGDNVYCRFSQNCQVSPMEQTDSYTTTNGAATCVLLSRSFPGTTQNTQGQYGYEYRLTLNSNGGTGSNVVTVSSLTLKFPDPLYFSYGFTASNQVWIISSGTDIVPAGAVESGQKVTFHFDPPITLSQSAQSTNTCLFGMVSDLAPQTGMATLAGAATDETNGMTAFQAQMQVQVP
ncbi:MAG TPA: hypothetical protein VMJ12_04530 [Candidatus Acidoferrales bacterium]|nr:hypothetical protein [Candidatus Acidoferrales bacterium]